MDYPNCPRCNTPFRTFPDDNYSTGFWRMCQNCHLSKYVFDHKVSTLTFRFPNETNIRWYIYLGITFVDSMSVDTILFQRLLPFDITLERLEQLRILL